MAFRPERSFARELRLVRRCYSLKVSAGPPSVPRSLVLLAAALKTKVHLHDGFPLDFLALNFL